MTYIASLAIQAAAVVAVVVIVVLLTRQGRRETSDHLAVPLAQVQESIKALKSETAHLISDLETRLSAQLPPSSSPASEAPAAKTDGASAYQISELAEQVQRLAEVESRLLATLDRQLALLRALDERLRRAEPGGREPTLPPVMNSALGDAGRIDANSRDPRDG